MDACRLFEDYHQNYPSHGYRWLNAKIKLDLGVVYSDNYAHQICKFLHIKSQSKHVKRYGKRKEKNREQKNFPNYILAELNPLRPFQIVVSDMTAFWVNKHYYELTLYMDLFNNEINLDVIKKSSIVKDSEIVYINDGDYISIYILNQQDTESYNARLYENLYVNSDKLVQYVDGDIISDYHEMNNAQIDNIANEYLSDYITLLENQGFQCIK